MRGKGKNVKGRGRMNRSTSIGLDEITKNTLVVDLPIKQFVINLLCSAAVDYNRDNFKVKHIPNVIYKNVVKTHRGWGKKSLADVDLILNQVKLKLKNEKKARKI